MRSDDLYNGLNTAKQLWFYGSASVLFFVTSIVILLKRKTSLRINLVDLSVLFFYLYFFARSIITPYTPILHNQKFLNWTILVIMYFIIGFTLADSSTGQEKTGDKCQILVKIQLIRFVVWVIILTGLAEAIWGLMQLYGFRQSFNSNFKITGSFFNPAPYALYLAAVFPMALGVWLYSSRLREEGAVRQGAESRGHGKNSVFNFRKIKENAGRFYSICGILNLLARFLSLITMIAIILVLPATMIRASWLGILAGSAIALNYRYDLLRKARAMLTTPARKVFVVTGAIFITVLSVTGLYFLKKGSSTGKLLIWEVTLGKIVEKPLFGYGTGRFEAEYNNWQAAYFKFHPEVMDGPKGMVAGNTKYCFNEYLEMASEIGIIGLLLFLSVIASIVFGIKNGKMTTTDARSATDNRMSPAGQMTAQPNDYRMTREAQLILIPSLVSMLVMASISFPFYSIPTLIIFFLLLAILSSYIEGAHLSERLIRSSIIRCFTKVSTFQLLNPPTPSTPSPLSTLSTFSTLLTISVLLLLLARQQYKAYYTFDESVMLYQTGSYEEACESFSEVYSALQYTGSFLQYYGKSLNMNEKYPRSAEILGRTVHFTSDEILYTTLGDTYKALKRYSEAEEAYRHASYMVPHKLYPLYLLAMLYDETGQKEIAVTVARRVLNKEIKVETKAIDEIRTKMKSIIHPKK